MTYRAATTIRISRPPSNIDTSTIQYIAQSKTTHQCSPLTTTLATQATTTECDRRSSAKTPSAHSHCRCRWRRRRQSWRRGSPWLPRKRRASCRCQENEKGKVGNSKYERFASHEDIGSGVTHMAVVRSITGLAF